MAKGTTSTFLVLKRELREKRAHTPVVACS